MATSPDDKPRMIVASQAGLSLGKVFMKISDTTFCKSS